MIPMKGRYTWYVCSEAWPSGFSVMLLFRYFCISI